MSRNYLRLLRVPPTVSSAGGFTENMNVVFIFPWQPTVAGYYPALRACARVVEVGQAFSLSCRPVRVHELGGCNCNFPFVRKQFVLAGEPADGEADHFPKPAASSAVSAYGLSRG